MLPQLAAMLPGGPKAYHSPPTHTLLRICSGDAATLNTVSMHDHAPCGPRGLHVFVCSDSIDIPMSLEVTIQSLYWPAVWMIYRFERLSLPSNARMWPQNLGRYANEITSHRDKQIDF